MVSGGELSDRLVTCSLGWDAYNLFVQQFFTIASLPVRVLATAEAAVKVGLNTVFV